MKKFSISAEYHGMNIYNYLKNVEMFSGRNIKKISIYVNNKKLKSMEKILKKGDEIKIIEEKSDVKIKAIDLPLDIVYEDKEILIINKQPFLIVHPTKKNTELSLANGIVAYYKKKGIEMVPRFYNRLDMNTSGLILIARSAFSQAFLQKHGDVKKKYLVIVKGILTDSEFEINKKISVSSDGIKRIVSEEGQDALTKFKVLERKIDKNITLLEAELLTGRTHQIRVHLSYLGFPVLGDSLYGGESILASRQMLHSFKLNFIHPFSKERVNFEVPLPEDMKKILE